MIKKLKIKNIQEISLIKKKKIFFINYFLVSIKKKVYKQKN
jgi:hypothetical protein